MLNQHLHYLTSSPYNGLADMVSQYLFYCQHLSSYPWRYLVYLTTQRDANSSPCVQLISSEVYKTTHAMLAI
jgi:hypothetical protein